MNAGPDFIAELGLRRPLMNAAGTLGFAPHPRGPVALERLGAFVTNPISLGPRTPAESRAMIAFPGGFLLHTGLPNPGLKRVLRLAAPRWAASNLPVIVHLLAATPSEVEAMVRRLEGVDGVRGFELGLSPDGGIDEALALLRAGQGELPLIPSLLPEQAKAWAAKLAQNGVRTLSFQAPRGLLAGAQGRLTAGRLYGPALLPATLATVEAVRRAGIAVIAAGGISTPRDWRAAHAAGACAVQLDSILWAGSADLADWDTLF